MDSSECEGLCVAELTDEEWDAAVRDGEQVEISGKCSAWRIVVGCIPMVENGQVRPICID